MWCSWTSRRGDRKQFAAALGMPEHFLFSMKLNKPVSSTSMWPSLSFKRPASAYRRRSSQILGQSGLADSLDNRLTAAE